MSSCQLSVVCHLTHSQIRKQAFEKILMPFGVRTSGPLASAASVNKVSDRLSSAAAFKAPCQSLHECVRTVAVWLISAYKAKKELPASHKQIFST